MRWFDWELSQLEMLIEEVARHRMNNDIENTWEWKDEQSKTYSWHMIIIWEESRVFSNIWEVKAPP